MSERPVEEVEKIDGLESTGSTWSFVEVAAVEKVNGINEFDVIGEVDVITRNGDVDKNVIDNKVN